MLAIIAKVELAAEDADRYIEAAQSLVAPTLKEKGCLVYGMARDICEPNVVWISEQWESQADLDAHLRTGHIRDFIAMSSTLKVLSMDARQYEVKSVGPVVMPED